MLTTKIIELEMSAQPKRGFTEVKQNDADGVQLKLILRNSDYTAYLIPDGAVVSFLAVKPDKKSVVLSSTDDNPRVTYTANSNIVLVTLPAQVLAVAGIILCNVTISKSGATTSTQTFTLSCAEALTANDLTSSSEFQSLSKMLADLTARKAEFDAINDKIANMALGYGGTFATLAALQADANANTPDGKKRFYIVAANGHHYYWSNITSAWTDGGAIIPYADVVALKNDVAKIFGEIGIGIEYGCEVLPSSPPTNDTVYVTAGVARLPNGQTVTISGQTVTIYGYGYGIIFINSSGAIGTLAGDDVNDPVPATPDGALLLAKVYLYDGTSTLDASKITDMRKFTYGLRSYVKNTTYESIGARMNAIEEDAETLEARVTQAETDIDSLQTSIAGHDTEIDALQVRAAQTDAELAAIRAAQAQMSGDTRINLNGTGKITAVPKNAAVLGVGGTIKGMTLTNLIINGNFSNGASGWTSVDAVVNGVAEKTAKAQYENMLYTVPSVSSYINHKIFLIARIKSDSNKVALQINDGTGVSYTYHSGSNQYEVISVIRTVSSSASLLHFKVQDDRSSAWTKFYVDWVVAIDMTAYGLDNKTASEMALLCSNYLSGTHNGNYFDGIWESGYYNITTGEKVGLSTAIRNKNKIPVPAGNIYISGLPSTGDKYALKYDINGNYLGFTYLGAAGSTTGSLTMSVAGYICFYATNTTVFPTQTQVELGTQSTIPMRLRSINGNYFDGIWELGYYNITTGAKASSSTAIRNKNKIPVPAGAIYISGLPSTGDKYALKYDINGNYLGNSYLNSAGNTVGSLTMSAAGYICFYATSTTVFPTQTQVESGTAATAYKARQETSCYIEPTVLRRNASGVYDEIDLSTGRLTIRLDSSGNALATPIIKYNVVTGTLLSYPKGLILCEPVIADAGVYDDGITILRTDYPIQSLETLCKINPDGTQSSLDVSAATITDAGTKITHPALSNGDIVAFTYFTASSGIIGENVFNYVNANGLTLGADGRYYKVGFAIDASGNISLTKTEVV